MISTSRILAALPLVAAATLGLLAHGGTAQAQSYTLTTLATFENTNGAAPFGRLTFDNAGNLIGTTRNGGTSGVGTVFRLNAGDNSISDLANLSIATGDGPIAGVTLDSLGNIYGVNFGGGSSSRGTLFQIDAQTDALSTLVTFNTANGARPQSDLVFDGSGNLYGTAQSGGANGVGTVFEYSLGTSAFNTIATFNTTNGSLPLGGLAIDAGGNLFGTTQGGGANNQGTVFEIAAGSNTITTLASFDSTNGSGPGLGAITLDGSGNLYGTTKFGGASNNGTVFEVAAGSNAITTLADFNASNGSRPNQGLLLDANGNLFGTTFSSAVGGGTVFEIMAGSNTLNTLVTFDGTNGNGPESGLAMDSSGNLYGTTNAGGDLNLSSGSGAGVVFKLSPAAAASAPEPGSVALLSAGMFPFLAIIARRRIQRA
jgi:uncharacterized repeat protein (TIGR03803 family)